MNLKDPAQRPCPVCGNSSVEVLHHQKFIVPDGYLLPDRYDVVWCTRCGFAYADTPATQEDYDRYYAQSSKYEDNATSTGGGGSGFDQKRLEDTAAAIAEVLPDRSARIVDVGCANGGLLGVLKQLGYDHLLGIDPSPACVRNTEQLHNVPAVTGSFRQLPANIGTFDMVILSHVLEHVADLATTVRDLKALLTPRGLLYIEVPDASRYAEFLLAPFQDFNTEHINHFGPSSLRALFEANGFTATRIGQKEIESSPGCPYPALFGFFTTGAATAAAEFQPDEKFHQQLLSYTTSSRAKIQAIDQRLSQIDSPSLLVWGTGQLAMKLLAETSLAQKQIAAFVDGNPINHGKTLRGIPIIAPEQITDAQTPILVATLLHQREITARIREDLGLTNPLVLLE
jgi:SAM-dependent methyltransferase